MTARELVAKISATTVPDSTVVFLSAIGREMLLRDVTCRNDKLVLSLGPPQRKESNGN